MSPIIRAASPDDASALAGIYNHYVARTAITFEEEAVGAEEMRRRMQGVKDLGLPWLVADSGGAVLGYAYGGQWKGRSAYRFTVECAIYLKDGEGGRGLGSRLYEALLSELRARKIHAAIGGITLPNEPSVRLHEKFGFKKVAHFHETGFKFGEWLDVGYWQTIL